MRLNAVDVGKVVGRAGRDAAAVGAPVAVCAVVVVAFVVAGAAAGALRAATVENARAAMTTRTIRLTKQSMQPMISPPVSVCCSRHAAAIRFAAKPAAKPAETDA